MIADLNLRTSRGAVQSCGSCGGLSEKEKVEFLDAPLNAKALIGSTVTAMRQ